jgi:hypothetical protein
MIERTGREMVEFAGPFFVEGLGRELPAGAYEVELVEESIAELSFLAYRVMSASIVLPLAGAGSHSYQLVRVDTALVQAARQHP